MPTKLSTTVSKIRTIPNNVNASLIEEFYNYMKDNDSSERHQNNALKVVIAYTKFLGGSGKTQLCHTLCAIAPQERCKGGVNGKAIYIDTGGKFRPERIVAIAKSRGFDVNYTLSNISHLRAMISQQQESFIHMLRSVIDKDNSIKLLIVDSVINNYRAEFSKLHTHTDRQKKLYKFISNLSNLTQIYNIAVVITNQVNFSNHLKAASL